MTDHSSEPARLDRAYRALAHPVRRAVLARQRERETTVTSVAALADHLASTLELDEERATRVLRHVHLPVLRDLGVVDYDERSGAVRYTVPDSVDAVLATTDSLGREPVASVDLTEERRPAER